VQGGLRAVAAINLYGVQKQKNGKREQASGVLSAKRTPVLGSWEAP
jgi:hypothetical protein